MRSQSQISIQLNISKIFKDQTMKPANSKQKQQRNQNQYGRQAFEKLKLLSKQQCQQIRNAGQLIKIYSLQTEQMCQQIIGLINHMKQITIAQIKKLAYQSILTQSVQLSDRLLENLEKIAVTDIIEISLSEMENILGKVYIQDTCSNKASKNKQTHRNKQDIEQNIKYMIKDLKNKIEPNQRRLKNESTDESNSNSTNCNNKISRSFNSIFDSSCGSLIHNLQQSSVMTVYRKGQNIQQIIKKNSNDFNESTMNITNSSVYEIQFEDQPNNQHDSTIINDLAQSNLQLELIKKMPNQSFFINPQVKKKAPKITSFDSDGEERNDMDGSDSDEETGNFYQIIQTRQNNDRQSVKKSKAQTKQTTKIVENQKKQEVSDKQPKRIKEQKKQQSTQKPKQRQDKIQKSQQKTDIKNQQKMEQQKPKQKQQKPSQKQQKIQSQQKKEKKQKKYVKKQPNANLNVSVKQQEEQVDNRIYIKLSDIHKQKQKYFKQNKRFNLKLKVVKKLFHIVLGPRHNDRQKEREKDKNQEKEKDRDQNRPKVKFVGGDDTGVIICFAILNQVIKQGEYIRLFDCYLDLYKNVSYEVSCDKLSACNQKHLCTTKIVTKHNDLTITKTSNVNIAALKIDYSKTISRFQNLQCLSYQLHAQSRSWPCIKGIAKRYLKNMSQIRQLNNINLIIKIIEVLPSFQEQLQDFYNCLVTDGTAKMLARIKLQACPDIGVGVVYYVRKVQVILQKHGQKSVVYIRVSKNNSPVQMKGISIEDSQKIKSIDQIIQEKSVIKQKH